VALSSGTVLFFENFHGLLVCEGCARENGLSVHGRFSAAHASKHVLMFGASLANGFSTWCGAIAQSGCLSKAASEPISCAKVPFAIAL
jgi:hypothetical protein